MLRYLIIYECDRCGRKVLDEFSFMYGDALRNPCLPENWKITASSALLCPLHIVKEKIIDIS
ncbi:unnamed protein product [marine sediment metagenome]|uniref:Uncharacterized protein n=1 Tax=marine sediment metagenome TaxID=412755 RepID=X1N0Z0_9ZZZZ